MSALFAYGTLLFPDVLRLVAGRVPVGQPAALDRFVRRRVVGEIFPAIVEGDDGDRVSGILYSGLEQSEWDRLDRFEGELYERREVVLDGRRAASTYVLGPSWRHRLGPEPWDPEAFARDHLDAFVARLARASDPRARE
jgi:gamma-glutamylcyclotransferase (GGCT)/AIG2-like uncharacterized protein YtfP